MQVSTRTHARPAQHENLEDALLLWINNMASRNTAVNDMMIIEKARELGDKLDITNFAYSRGWLNRMPVYEGR